MFFQLNSETNATNVTLHPQRAGYLRKRMITHSGENSNKRNQCDFASSQADNLKKHMKTHSGKSQTNVTNVTLHPLRQAI